MHLCSGLLLPPRVAVSRFDAVDPYILSLLRSGGLYTTLDDFSAAAEGLAVWRSALAAGRVPDFEGVDAAAGVGRALPKEKRDSRSVHLSDPGGTLLSLIHI